MLSILLMELLKCVPFWLLYTRCTLHIGQMPTNWRGTRKKQQQQQWWQNAVRIFTLDWLWFSRSHTFHTHCRAMKFYWRHFRWAREFSIYAASLPWRREWYAESSNEITACSMCICTVFDGKISKYKLNCAFYAKTSHVHSTHTHFPCAIQKFIH